MKFQIPIPNSAINNISSKSKNNINIVNIAHMRNKH